MKNSAVLLADLDEMVFETREHGYGAYQLRKDYNRSLSIALAVGTAIFLFLTVGPWLYENFLKAAPLPTDIGREVVINLEDLPPPPSIDEETPPPPPPDLPPPRITSIAFQVPTPVPDDEIVEEETIHEMDSIMEVDNIAFEDVAGDIDGYNFGEIEGDGEVVAEIEEPNNDPDPGAFIMVEKEPSPVNMDNIKQLIGYPPPAKEAEIEGKVILRILVGADGNYEKHIVIKNPHPILTKAVEAQVNHLSFTPGIQAGKPIKVWVTIPFDFKLLR